MTVTANLQILPITIAVLPARWSNPRDFEAPARNATT
jgi:hypothetical protein